MLQHVKTVHKITYTGKARQYEYEFDNRTQSTLPFAKKSRGDDNEPWGAAAADITVEEKIEVEKDVDDDTQSTKLSLQLPDTNEVGAYKEPILSLRWKNFSIAKAPLCVVWLSVKYHFQNMFYNILNLQKLFM